MKYPFKMKGIVLRNSWTPANETRISIYTFDDESEYLVNPNACESKLKFLMGNTVEVNGQGTESEIPGERHKKTVTINSFRICDT